MAERVKAPFGRWPCDHDCVIYVRFPFSLLKYASLSLLGGFKQAAN